MIGVPSWFGDCAVVIPVGDPEERTALVDRLAAGSPGWQVRAGLTLVLVEVHRPDSGLLDHVTRLLAAPVAGGEVARQPHADIRISVRYDGADLEDVATWFGLGADDVVRAHSQQEWRVAMMGFAPGFGYLEPVGVAMLDWMRLPRRDSPRPRVPRGSVAVAAGMSAVYPEQMPGGWHLLGRTEAVLFDASHEHRPARLAPGDHVRFVVEGGL